MSMAETPIAEPVTVEAASGVTFTPQEWATRVADIRTMLEGKGLTEADLRQALAEMLFTDSDGRVWFYDGTTWLCQDGDQWAAAVPTGQLSIRPWTMQWMVLPDDPGPTASTAITPTHRVGASELPTWPMPDPTAAPGPPLAAGLEVHVSEVRGDWAEVTCSNGWSAWVDVRQLIPL